MTYSIIPPILVILSVIGIILFLLKKASQVALLGEGREKKFSESLRGSFSREKVETGEQAGFKKKFSDLSGKTSGKFKSAFSGVGNKFSSWNKTIREKREEKTRDIESEKQATEMGSSQDITERVRSYQIDPNRRNRMAREKNIMLEPQEKPARPFISEKITKPKPRAEVKDRLEKLLIERIAVNPKDIEAYERLGEYYFEIGNLEYSKECFKQVIKLDPTNVSIKSKMRKLERLLGN